MGSPRNAGLPLSILHLAGVLEGRWPWSIADGNLGGDLSKLVLSRLAARPHALVGITVMPGTQVLPAIEVSAAIRAAFPSVPIVWGGYFPTLYPDAALNAPYVDYLIRGQGEATLCDLLEHIGDAGPPSEGNSGRNPSAIRGVAGLTWKQDARIVHNPDRAILHPDT